jgi:hypothetical protein
MLVAAHAQDAAAPADPAAPAEIVPVPEAGAEEPAPLPDVTLDSEPVAEETLAETWTAIPVESVMAEELNGAEIRTATDDERVATVGETMAAADGTVQGIVAEFGGFLGFGRERVMLSVEDFEVFKDPDGRVLIRTGLTRDAMEAMPEYEG